MIGATSGLGYMTIEAVQFFQTDTVLLGMIIIGVLWLVMDKVIFATLERKTVVRWGLLQR
jgi:NitT/TauT family transport system permease protein/taurine transport system permease protein